MLGLRVLILGELFLSTYYSPHPLPPSLCLSLSFCLLYNENVHISYVELLLNLATCRQTIAFEVKGTFTWVF